MPSSQFRRPIEILLVEDSPGDARLTKEALDDSSILSSLSVLEDGEAALSYLRREGRYEDAARPDLILLDLTLPKKDGREVLVDIKEDPKLRRIPVVVLTGSRDEKDVLQSYKERANAYVTKPLDMDQLVEIVKSIESFWFAVVQLPSE